MSYEIICTPGKVAVVLDQPEEMATSHIIKPDTVKGDNYIGTVIAVNYEGDEGLLQKNSRVVVPRYTTSPVTLNGREILFMRITDVLALLYPVATHAGVSGANHL